MGVDPTKHEDSIFRWGFKWGFISGVLTAAGVVAIFTWALTL